MHGLPLAVRMRPKRLHVGTRTAPDLSRLEAVLGVKVPQAAPLPSLEPISHLQAFSLALPTAFHPRDRAPEGLEGTELPSHQGTSLCLDSSYHPSPLPQIDSWIKSAFEKLDSGSVFRPIILNSGAYSPIHSPTSAC